MSVKSRDRKVDRKATIAGIINPTWRHDLSAIDLGFNFLKCPKCGYKMSKAKIQCPKCGFKIISKY